MSQPTPQIEHVRILTEKQIHNLSDGSFRLYRTAVKDLKNKVSKWPTVTDDESLATVHAVTYAWAAVQREHNVRWVTRWKERIRKMYGG